MKKLFLVFVVVALTGCLGYRKGYYKKDQAYSASFFMTGRQDLDLEVFSKEAYLYPRVDFIKSVDSGGYQFTGSVELSVNVNLMSQPILVSDEFTLIVDGTPFLFFLDEKSIKRQQVRYWEYGGKLYYSNEVLGAFDFDEVFISALRNAKEVSIDWSYRRQGGDKSHFVSTRFSDYHHKKIKKFFKFDFERAAARHGLEVF